MSKMRWKGLAMIVVALAFLVTIFAPSGVADDRRLVADVDEPFEVNGELYPAGMISVKKVRDYNPSSSLSEIWVGRTCLGLFQASRVPDDSTSSHDTLNFERTSEGHLALVGFATNAQSTREAYRFVPYTREEDKAPSVLARQ